MFHAKHVPFGFALLGKELPVDGVHEDSTTNQYVFLQRMPLLGSLTTRWDMKLLPSATLVFSYLWIVRKG